MNMSEIMLGDIFVHYAQIFTQQEVAEFVRKWLERATATVTRE